MTTTSELILLTLPRSKQLRPLIPLILDQLSHVSLRLAVSRDNYQHKADELVSSVPEQHRTRMETAQCDLTNYADVQHAVAGASVVIHNGPPFHPLETAIGQAVVAAAPASGTVKHIVFCSVIHPLRTKMTNHAAKLAVEERVVESGLGYTILRPTHVMQNLPLKTVIETRTIAVPYAGDVLHGFVDLNDERDVILAVLKDLEKHNRATYELVGCNGTYEDVARAFGKVTGGGPFQVTQTHPDDLAKRVGLSDPAQLEGMKRMLFYYQTRGLPGNNNVLRMLLGREPSDWEAFLRRELKS
ncbi:NAD(P)-binding protein [Auricularia subglabra TFB-10046 SS5]|nr:NAD(P)-binding protein [Auricularia subglabra TFB-10046 SS5]